MIKACIFDLDGVIVDTAKYHFLAWNRLANTLGFEITKENNELLKGVSRMESLDVILSLAGKTLTQVEKENACIKKNEWYVEFISKMDENEILPGAVTLLDELIENNIKIALGSASKNAVPLLTKLNIIDRFEVIVDGTKTTKSKPHPQVFLMGAEALNVKPEESIVFEDSVSGIQAANTGNFMSVGIGDEDQLHEANIIFGGLNDINLLILQRAFAN